MPLTDCSIQLLGFALIALWGWQLSKQLRHLQEQQKSLHTSLLEPVTSLKTTLDNLAYQQTSLQQHVTQENKVLQQQLIQQSSQLNESLSQQYETHFVDFIHNLTATINGEPSEANHNSIEASETYDPKNPPKADCFSGHYTDWTIKRVRRIIQHFGADFFEGKRILDLGCGYGHVGSLFAHLGATVVYSDARADYAEEVLKRDPSGTFITADLDHEFPFEGQFDLILNVGVLYHLSQLKPFIERCCKATAYMVLETEVCNSTDPDLVLFTEEEGYDQAFNSKGSRPSSAYVEAQLREQGCLVEALADDSCNSSFHRYDWAVDESTTYEHGLRRLWFVQTPLASNQKKKKAAKKVGSDT